MFSQCQISLRLWEILTILLPKFIPLYDLILYVILDQRVYIHGGAASPRPLVQAMCRHGKSNKLKNVEVIEAPTQWHADYTNKEYEGRNIVSDFDNFNLILIYDPDFKGVVEF